MKSNKCLYFLKGISCLIVILLHIPIPGVIGDAIIYGLRFPVPIFFMISGYVCYFRDLKWLKTSCLKTLKLLLYSELACAIVTFVFCDGSVLDQIKSMRIWSHPITTIMFGTLFNSTLWYLYAMLWTWIVMYFIKSRNITNCAYVLIPILLMVHIIGRLIIQKYSDINEWIVFLRSWILYGLPFVLLGHFVAENEERLHITNLKCVLLMSSGGIVMIAEYLIWCRYMDLWFSTVLITLALFLFALIHYDKDIIPFISKIGKNYSKVIYVSHIPVSIIISNTIGRCTPETVFAYIHPLLVIAGSLVTAFVIERISIRRRSS